jgi:hypothetical protein
MAWITLQPCIVTRDGKSVRLGKQEPIPEAEFYTLDIRNKLVRTKFIAQIPDPAQPASPPAEVSIKKDAPEPVTAFVSDDENGAIPPVKRKRGRPKKVKVEEQSEG